MESRGTRSRIKDALLDAVRGPDDLSLNGGLICRFAPRARVRSQPDLEDPIARPTEGRDQLFNDYCHELFAATSSIDRHVQRLDEIYSKIFTLELCLGPDQSVQAVSDAVYDFLQRLPIQPLGLPGIRDLPDDYFEAIDKSSDSTADCLVRRSLVWPCLKVTSGFNTNVIRVILFREVYRQKSVDGVEEKHLVEVTAELLHRCSILEGKCSTSDPSVSQRWLIVRCFLWASWQRAQMLYFYRILHFRLTHGVENDLGSLTILRSTLVAPGMTIQQLSDQAGFEGKPDYMCSWAFNLLRTDGIAIGSDFRAFHMRYNQLFGHLDGRCKEDSTESCDGTQLGNCMRSRMEVEDQSMHDWQCERKQKGSCPKLVWDEDSYRAVQGGRAVAVSENDLTDYENGLLKYTSASNRTLAISHAWSHGQGGRPDTGLNQCLHVRYVQLAQANGCDSYFLDTVCIPEAHDLRKEAIKAINSTFYNSKITLIVDKDLMSVDISEMSTELQEALLISVLVSDWNVRAWTLLEAMRGRQNVHILCRNAMSISYRQLIQTVTRRGRIDIAIFALLAPHLLSWTADPSRWQDSIGLSNPSLETAGSLLSYRPASRLGDNIAIWSLMVHPDDILADSAEEFWHHLIGKYVATGFLMSSAARIAKEGLTWAPRVPYAAPQDELLPQQTECDPKIARHFFRAFTGEESEYALIKKEGIFAAWYISPFDADLMRPYLERLKLRFGRREPSSSTDPATLRELNKIRLHFLVGYKYGALIQAKRSKKDEPWLMHPHIAEYSGGVDGTLVAVLGAKKGKNQVSTDERKCEMRRWYWRGVYEWPADVELPEFEEDKIWIS